MSNDCALKVAENSKKLAAKYVEEGNFGRAFAHYLVALNLNLGWKQLLEEEFTKTLYAWTSILAGRERFTDCFKCYEQAVEIYPENKIILNNLGAHLLRCGLLNEAAHYFRRCLRIDVHFLRATRNLENVSNLAVERWHFRMLNDQHRNEAYKRAITKKILDGCDRVLDVGTGTGILSLFSFEANAKEIYACDSSPTMIEIAEQVIRCNQATGIILLSKHSAELKIPEDISSRVLLLVTEIFDAGLLGEHVLPTLAHAWRNLLLPPRSGTHHKRHGVVIPFGSVMYLTGVQLDGVSNGIHLKTGGFYDNIKCNIYGNSEDYDTQDLKRTPFRYLTNVEEILRINFNDPKLIDEVLRGEHDRPFVLKCTQSGRLDCVAVWFDLLLDEDIVINTGPESKTNGAWDQAIFPLPRSRLVKTDQEITIQLSFKSGKLNVEFSEEAGNNFAASQDLIRILNDDKLVNGLHELARRLSFESSVRILDSFPFPVFGFSYLITRNKKFNDELTCFANSEKDQIFINFLADKYKIKVDCKLSKSFAVLEEEKFDVVLLDLVERSGELKDGILMELEYFRSFLNPSGMMLPERITIMGQFIHSDWLVKASKVISDDVTCGYKIGRFINVYQVKHVIDLDFRAIGKTSCSLPFKLFDFWEDSETVTQMKIPCLSSECSPNAMIYWFRIGFTESCDEFITNESSSRFRQSAFLFEENRVFNEVKFNVVRNDGLFKIELLPG